MSNYHQRPGYEEQPNPFATPTQSQPSYSNQPHQQQQQYQAPSPPPTQYQPPSGNYPPAQPPVGSNQQPNQGYNQQQTNTAPQANGYQGGNGNGGNGGSGGGYAQRPSNNSYGNGNRSNFSGNKGGFNRGGGAGGFNRPTLTPEELARLPLPKSAVITGNHNPPEQLLPVIMRIVELLKEHGFIIRTGAMDGVEKMVMENVPGCELHIPWKGFNQVEKCHSSFNTDEVKEYAKRFHEGWAALKDSHQAFWAKNARLVLGKDVKSPCQVSIVWSEDGVESAATRTSRSGPAGHVAAISRAMYIPVFNINNPDAEQRLRQFLQG